MNAADCLARIVTLLALGCGLTCCTRATAADSLPGEFTDIDLGHELFEPRQVPSLQELREMVKRPDIVPVVMLRLYNSQHNQHLPVFSEDGQRLAFQRSDVQSKGSRILLFLSLSQAEPQLLSDHPGCYDYMFRWAVNSPGSFSFVRIDPDGVGTQVFFANAGEELQRRTPSAARHRFPSVYIRTDGIRRLVYDHDGQLMHQSWNDRGPIDSAAPLLRGTSPRWSRDGHRLLLAREQLRSGKAVNYDIVVWNLRSEKELLLPSGGLTIVRSPTWSPDEQAVAFFARQSGEGKPWRIRVCPVVADSAGQTLGTNVVVNQEFESEGPAWEPSGERIWCFSHDHRSQAYYPLVATKVTGGEPILVHYPKRCTTPNDLSFNLASTAVPEMAFVGHVGPPQDLFVLFLNHF